MIDNRTPEMKLYAAVLGSNDPIHADEAPGVRATEVGRERFWEVIEEDLEWRKIRETLKLSGKG